MFALCLTILKKILQMRDLSKILIKIIYPEHVVYKCKPIFLIIPSTIFLKMLYTKRLNPVKLTSIVEIVKIKIFII